MDKYCFNLFLSLNIFSPSMVSESFAGYGSLGLHPWSLSVCSTSIQDLLAFVVSFEKLGVILFLKDLFIYYVYNIPSMYACMPEEGIRSHYRSHVVSGN